MGALANALLVPPAAAALDLVFVFDGVVGTFRALETGKANGFPPAAVDMTSTASSGSPKGRYDLAPRCLLPECGYVSVTADGSTVTTPASFHGHNAGWQLLITSPAVDGPGVPPWPLYGSLTYCPGYEVHGDAEQCPTPGPGTEPRAGWLTPPPHADPRATGTPGPLPLLGVVAALRFSLKLKSRIGATPQR
jgi:hypothetical protein